MFKFNFDNSEENKNEKDVTAVNKDDEALKESKLIEISSERHKEITENFSNFNFDVFISNEIEIGFISLVDNRSTDLIAGEYEGGFKIWECTQDLVDLFSGSDENVFKSKKVCDLGCSGER